MKIKLFFIFLIIFTSCSSKYNYDLSVPHILETAPKQLNNKNIIDVKEMLLYLIEKANFSIDIEALYFTKGNNIKIKKAARRGVQIRFLLDDSEFARTEYKKLGFENQKNIQVKFLNIAPYGKNKYGNVHNKCIIIDRKYAILGSANFSYPALNKNREVNIFLCDEQNLKTIQAVFDFDWAKSADEKIKFEKLTVPEETYIVEGVPKEFDNPYIPNIDWAIKRLLSSAKSTIKVEIYFYTSFYTNNSIFIKELKNAKKRGVDIQFLVNDDTITEKNPDNTYKNKIVRDALKLLLDNKILVKSINVKPLLKKEWGTVHSKIVIVDGKIGMVGSNNWTAGSLYENRELAVVTSNPELVKDITTIFDTDWEFFHSKRLEFIE